MIQKKCKICGEWFDSKKIAMHYWNIHKKKYSEYKTDEETREIEGEENEKSTTKKTTTKTSSTNTGTQEVVIQATPIETETVQEGTVQVPTVEPIKEAEMWKETAHLFDDIPQNNEASNELRRVYNPGGSETVNEWCN